MKLTLIRSLSCITNVNSALAGYNLSPTMVALVAGNKPSKKILPAVPTASYAGLGASGGVYTGASASAGIKVAFNGAWIPVKLETFRTTVGYKVQIVAGPSLVDCGTLFPRATILGTPSTAPALSGFGMGLPLFSYGGATGTIFTPEWKLNYTNSDSSDVISQLTKYAESLGYSFVASTVGYPVLSGNAVVPTAFGNQMVDNGAWDVTGAVVGTPTFSFTAFCCEYSEISIDDTLIAGSTTGTGDVFVVLPVSTGLALTSSAVVGTSTIQVALTRQVAATEDYTYTPSEQVLPLSYIRTQNAAGLIGQNYYTTLYANQNVSDAGGKKYDFNIAQSALVSFGSLSQIFLPRSPAFTGTVGPY